MEKYGFPREKKALKRQKAAFWKNDSRKRTFVGQNYTDRLIRRLLKTGVKSLLLQGVLDESEEFSWCLSGGSELAKSRTKGAFQLMATSLEE